MTAPIPIKMVACDLDGTLIGPGGSGIEAAKQVVEHCKSKGCSFTIATGRVFGSVERYLSSLGVDEPVITNGGALIAALEQEPMMEIMIDPETSRRIAGYLRGLYLPFYFIAGKDMYTEWAGPETDRYMEYISYDIAVVPSLDDLEVSPTQIVVRVPPGDALRYVADFREAFGAGSEVLLSLPHLIEIQAPGVSKASALEYLSRKMGIGREEVLAIGDSLNDLDMLTWAGRSACVANSHPHVIALAGEVSAGRFSEGVLEIVRKAL